MRKGAELLGLPSAPADLLAHAERWRPWRAYAVQHLWAADDHPINHWPPKGTQHMTTTFRTIDSPVGALTLAGRDGVLTHLRMDDQRHAPADQPDWEPDADAFGDVAEQLEAYFAGELTEFDVDLRLEGTDFQQRGLGGAAGDPVRRDLELRRARRPHRQAGRGPGGGRWPTGATRSASSSPATG